MQRPILPRVDHDGDAQNFDIYPEVDLNAVKPAPDKDRILFDNF